MAEAITAAAELEKAIAQAIADGECVEGSPKHLHAKRELQKMRDSIGLSTRRSPP